MKQSTTQQQKTNLQGGKLIICPTPLGNLGDVTARSLEALRAADVVCAEDTRVTARLLAAFDIHASLERLDEASLTRMATSVINRVLAGKTIAYCTDAGMPGVSDPGLRLVSAARAAGAPVEVLPGPSAVTLAYVASGCENQHFFFGGFFPRKNTERSAILDQLSNMCAALIFYESPKRLVSALSFIAQTFPLREVAVCRELTKVHEEVVRGISSEVLATFKQRECQGPIKGEIVIVIDGRSVKEEKLCADANIERATKKAKELVQSGETSSRIARVLAKDFGISRNSAYEIALAAVHESSQDISQN